MRAIWTDDRMEGIRERLQSEAIGGCAVEDEENFNVVTELLLELSNGGSGVRVIAVADNVPLIYGRKRLQHFRMHTGVVVAGKATDWLHGSTNLADSSHLTGHPGRAAGLSFLGTLVTLKQLPGRDRVQFDIGSLMLLAVTIVLGGFGLLYLAVRNEERHMSRTARQQKR